MSRMSSAKKEKLMRTVRGHQRSLKIRVDRLCKAVSVADKKGVEEHTYEIYQMIDEMVEEAEL